MALVADLPEDSRLYVPTSKRLNASDAAAAEDLHADIAIIRRQVILLNLTKP